MQNLLIIKENTYSEYLLNVLSNATKYLEIYRNEQRKRTLYYLVTNKLLQYIEECRFVLDNQKLQAEEQNQYFETLAISSFMFLRIVNNAYPSLADFEKRNVNEKAFACTLTLRRLMVEIDDTVIANQYFQIANRMSIRLTFFREIIENILHEPYHELCAKYSWKNRIGLVLIA